ncbi:MAG: hypothetical protein QW733_06620 [Desulfurococcaceae archaeon]
MDLREEVRKLKEEVRLYKRARKVMSYENVVNILVMLILEEGGQEQGELERYRSFLKREIVESVMEEVRSKRHRRALEALLVMLSKKRRRGREQAS